MQKDLEEMIRTIAGTPQGAKALSNLDGLTKALNTPEGKGVLEMLSGSGGDAVKSAAAKAAAGDKNAVRTMMATLMSTKEGAALVSRLIKLLGS